MKTRLTPHYIDLVYNACLHSFWRRKALSKFLRQCGIAEGFLAGWNAEESKRDLLDRLFPELIKTDRGRAGLFKMSSFLMEQETFPDLEGWEDSEVKLNSARDAVRKLKMYHSKQQEEIQSDEERVKAKQAFRKHQEEATRSQQTLSELNERLNALVSELGTQEGGYKLQDWFYDLVDFSEINNRRPYKHGGRQIDGSVTVSGTTYLVELKFTAEPAIATDIDSFHRKVSSKADNTMGIMVSISGYTSVAIEEASGEKTPLLLLDHGHIYLVLGGTMGLAEVIDRVRRHASQTGEAYLSAKDFGGS